MISFPLWVLAMPLSAQVCRIRLPHLQLRCSQGYTASQTEFVVLRQAPLEDGVAPVFLSWGEVDSWGVLALHLHLSLEQCRVHDSLL